MAVQWKMTLTFGLFFVSFLAIAISDSSRVSYENYRVFDIESRDVSDLEFLRSLPELMNAENDIDFWKLTRNLNDSSHVMVSPKIVHDFEVSLLTRGLKYSIMIDNVEKVVENERRIQEIFKSLRSTNILTSYLRYDEITKYLENLQQQYSNFVTLKNVGISYEGRYMKTITISNGTNPKNKIFLDAGIHAREWIAPATALYVINELTENARENSELLDKFEWVILPVINPDGYEYSQTKERFWRKTRQPNNGCSGTDGNRNFDYHYGEVGASNNGCAETYRGPTAFSEPETQIVRDIMEEVKGTCKFYLTLHSYGNYLLYPWGYTSELPDNVEDLDQVSKAGAAAIKTATGSRYTVGSSTNVLYAAAGGSDDYALGAKGIPISITMELPGGGSGGFDPPARNIERMVKESWIGIKAMALEVSKLYK